LICIGLLIDFIVQIFQRRKVNPEKDLLQRLIYLEKDVLYNSKPTICEPEFKYLRGTIPILLSAPHGSAQTRNGELKEEDEYTAGIARLVAKLTEAYVIYARRYSKTDPNYYSDIPYKDKLLRIITDNKIKFVLDIHGANQKRHFGIAIGSMGGVSCKAELPIIVQSLLESGFSEDNSDVLSRLDIDRIFRGLGDENQETVIGYLHKKGIRAAQFEINATLRVPIRRQDAHADEKDFKGDPAMIIHLINTLVDLVNVLNEKVVIYE
jgi:hypothetical protein